MPTQVVPIEADADGVLRVGGTRVTLETVLTSHRAGATPEEILRRYPTLDLADIYAVISYVLRNPGEVEAYLQRRAQDAARVQRENESRFNPEGIRDRLRERRDSSGMRRDVQVGTDQADHGLVEPLSDQLIEDIKARGRERLAARTGQKPA
jgi:uncharacterized protein (DUF433 family)